jgi:lipid A 3-O-deacylase
MVSNRRWGGLAVWGLVGLMHAVAAGAVDRVAVELGTGDEDAVRGGLALQWDLDGEWLSLGGWFLGGFLELSGSYWEGHDGTAGNASLGEVGVTPVLRVNPRSPIGGITPYLEGGIGLHLFSDTEFGDRDFDIAFSFGDHLGAGLQFGPNGAFDFGYRYQHLSNLSIGDSNPGINFHLIRLGYHF